MTKNKNNQAFKEFIPYLLKFPKEIIFSIFLGISSGLTIVFMTFLIGKSIDTMIDTNNVSFTLLIRFLILLFGTLAISILSQWIIQRLGNRVSSLAVSNLRKDAFQSLNKLPLNYYDQTAHGDIISRFTNDIETITVACSAIFNQLFSGLAIVFISLIFMLKLSHLLTLVVLISTPIIFIINWIITRTSQKHFDQQQKIVGDISAFVTEMIGHQKIVKAFQQEKIMQDKFEKINEKLNINGQKAQFSSSLTNPLARFIDHLTYLTIGLVGGLCLLNGNQHITVGIISSFTIYASQFSKPFIEISGISTQIQTALVSLNRTFELIHQKPEKTDGQSAIELTDVEGTIIFNQVNFSYLSNKPLITDFNLTVLPGETIAIVGKTGAGKSTLVNLLMRFYEISSGSITIDNHDIQHITRNSLRRNFGMVLQETWLVDGTIRDNLTYGNPTASESDIKLALKKASIFDFVTRLPKGLDTHIGTSGIKISEGQRQLLTIARTMISNPAMLILDEATSSVDTLTEKKIQEAFLQMMIGRTSFVIAHRLATIKSADKILVMDQGAIVEIGTHDQLLLKNNGFYHKLYTAQFDKN